MLGKITKTYLIIFIFSTIIGLISIEIFITCNPMKHESQEVNDAYAGMARLFYIFSLLLMNLQALTIFLNRHEKIRTNKFLSLLSFYGLSIIFLIKALFEAKNNSGNIKTVFLMFVPLFIV